MKKIADADFQTEVVSSASPVLVDVYADWCRPCQMMAPTLEKLSQDYSGKVSFVKMDGESEVQTVNNFSVSSLPTILLFKGGELVKTLTGLQSEDAIRTELDALL